MRPVLGRKVDTLTSTSRASVQERSEWREARVKAAATQGRREGGLAKR